MGSKKEIIEAALKLSEEERLEMADLLFDSVGGPPDSRTAKEWDEEIQRRIKAVDAGETKVISWEEALRHISRPLRSSTTPQ